MATGFDVGVALAAALAVAGLLLWAIIKPGASRLISIGFIVVLAVTFSLRLGYTFLGPNADLPLRQIRPPYISWLPLVFLLSFVLLQTRLALWLSLAFYGTTLAIVLTYALVVAPQTPWSPARIGLVQQFVLGHAIYIVLLMLIPMLQGRYARSVREMESLRQQNLAQQRLATIINASQDAIILTDLDGIITDWNPAATRIYGYAPEEMTGQPLHRLLPPELDGAMERNLAEVAKDNAVIYEETVRLAKNGERIDLQIAITPVRNADGAIVGAASTGHDIRPAKRARAALAESEQRFRETFDNAPIGLALVSPEGRWLEVNAALCDIVGYSSEELLQIDFQTITHPDDLDSDLELLGKLLAGEINSYQLDKRYFHKNGSEVSILLAVSLVRDADNQPVHFVSQIEDVTRQRRMQAELLQRSQALEKSNAELESYAHVVSHDLREPLRGIGGFVGLLQRRLGDQLDPTSTEYMQLITDSVKRGESLISDLLEYASVGGEREFETVDSNRALALVRDTLRTQVEQNGASIHSEELHAVHANALDLQRLFQNLIGNAIKFAALNPAEGHRPQVSVSSRPFDGGVEFCIRDNGPGIAPEFANEVFRIFRRLHGRNVNGTGIGLAICRKLVESYGHSIRVESQIGEGASFYFTLPSPARR